MKKETDKDMKWIDLNLHLRGSACLKYMAYDV